MVQRRSSTNWAFLRLVLDIALTELALFVAGLLVPVLQGPLRGGQVSNHPLIYLLVALLWGLAFLVLSVYAADEIHAVDNVPLVLAAATLATVVLAGTLFFLFPRLSRLQIVAFYGLDLVLLAGWRLGIRLVLRLSGRPQYPVRKVLILGAAKEGRDVAHTIADQHWAGLELVGFLDDDLARQSMVDGYPVFGRIDELEQQVSKLGIDEVVVAMPPEAYERLFRLTGQLERVPARVRMVPNHIRTALFRTRIQEVAGVPMITLHKPVLTDFERQVKRIFDIIVGGLTLALMAPVLVLVGVAIRMDSPGPILFKQRRIGENGHPFWMYKFRSMVQEAEQQLSEQVRESGDGTLLFKYADDPRVTRVGKFIRRTSLDEFPQLLNVFRGEMSLVGPRPELPWLAEDYQPWQRQRLEVPQGITGWWQVNGRSDKPMHLHTEEDLIYIQNYSFLLDILILWQTVGTVIRGKGAY